MGTWWGSLALCLAATAGWADGDMEAASAALAIDIQSAVTLSLSDLGGLLLLDETAVENQTYTAGPVNVQVRANDEAALTITSTPLAPADEESAGGPSVPPGTTDSLVLDYDMHFSTSLSPDTWEAPGATFAYPALSTSGVQVRNGANGSGQLWWLVRTGSYWQDAFAGAYSATLTATLTAAGQ